MENEVKRTKRWSSGMARQVAMMAKTQGLDPEYAQVQYMNACHYIPRYHVVSGEWNEKDEYHEVKVLDLKEKYGEAFGRIHLLYGGDGYIYIAKGEEKICMTMWCMSDEIEDCEEYAKKLNEKRKRLAKGEDIF